MKTACQFQAGELASADHALGKSGGLSNHCWIPIRNLLPCRLHRVLRRPPTISFGAGKETGGKSQGDVSAPHGSGTFRGRGGEMAGVGRFSWSVGTCPTPSGARATPGPVTAQTSGGRYANG